MYGIIGQHSFRVELPSPLHCMHNLSHVSSRRKYHGDGPYQPPTIPEVEDSELVFEVDHISDARGVPRRQYLVHLTGGGYGWHDAMLLHGCDQHIREFWCRRNRESPVHAFPLSLSDRLAELLEVKHASGGISVTTKLFAASQCLRKTPKNLAPVPNCWTCICNAEVSEISDHQLYPSLLCEQPLTEEE